MKAVMPPPYSDSPWNADSGFEKGKTLKKPFKTQIVLPMVNRIATSKLISQSGKDVSMRLALHMICSKLLVGCGTATPSSAISSSSIKSVCLPLRLLRDVH